jgi:N-acetyl sugar amidotransferase
MQNERTVSNIQDLKRCSRCVMPETQEFIAFDNEGVCTTCRNIDIKHEKIDWNTKKQEFKDILDQYRGKYDYDCIIPFSGGKDSCYAAYSLVRDYGLRPLVISYDHHMIRPQTVKNREKVLKKLGIDFLSYRTNWKLVKKLIRIGLERKGNIYWYQETGIFAFPMHMAIELNIPLVIWGEPSAEYTNYYAYNEAEEVDETRFNMFVNMGITAEDMIGFLRDDLADKETTMKDLKFHVYPKREELKKIGVRSICLGSFQPWDVKKQVEIIKDELGWEGDVVEGVPPEYNYEKVEDMLQGVQDYLKFIKRGYGRMSHLASIDIRNGRLTREAGMKLVQEYEGLRPGSLDVLLKWLDIDEDTFYKITKQHTVKPWQHDPFSTKKGPQLPDQKDWIVN